MKRITFNLLSAIFVWLSSCLIPAARGDPPLITCDSIQLTGSQIEDCSAKGEFQPVPTSPLDTASVSLQFDPSLAGTEVAVQALDGGTLGINGSVTIDQDGNLSFPYQIGEQPGLYRVSVVADMGNGSVPISMVQFQVPNPQQ